MQSTAKVPTRFGNQENTLTSDLKQTCQICRGRFKAWDVVHADRVGASIQAIVDATIPTWKPEGVICYRDLAVLRSQHIHQLLERERGELTRLDASIVRSIAEDGLVTEDVNSLFLRRQTFGDRLSDAVAAFGGSWRFIVLFAVVLAVWMFGNRASMPWPTFDPYPFIFLNLILSTLAAIQAPVILMSQNRQSSKDRLAAEHDYKINLKAEIEIRNLTARIDHLSSLQSHSFLEMQGAMMDIIDERMRRPDKP